ncbi:MAG TPA: hypothetical protein VHN77_12210 [Phycisphaerales bacterium]|nr:hypothetical protein [Phycisphaerales bacterium]
MSVLCPVCRKEIDPDDVNVAADVAFCRACNNAAKLSAIAEEFSERREAARSRLTVTEETDGDASIPAPDLANPPKGCWYRDDGLEARVGATCRSLAGAAFMLFFTLFWNGVVSVFVVINVASTLVHLGVAVPAWFPSPKGNTAPNMPLGMTLFLWLFLTPFILIGAFTAAMALTSLFGHVEVRVRDTHGTVFTGVGPVGWKRRFDVANVRGVAIGQTSWKENNQTKPVIVIEADKTIRFGSMLHQKHRTFVAGALRNLLAVHK